MEYAEQLRRELNLALDEPSVRGIHSHPELRDVTTTVENAIRRVYPPPDGPGEALLWAAAVSAHRGAGHDEALRVRSADADVRLPSSSGIDHDVATSGRFQGTYCLWTRRGAEEWQTLSTSNAMDAKGLLRGNLNSLIDAQLRSPSGADSNHRLTQKIFTEVGIWEHDLKGLTSPSTVTRAQMAELAREAPEWRKCCSAALSGNPGARSECFRAINAREWEKNDLALHSNPYVPHTHTWSLWTSKGHPEDRTLVVTDRAIDALSYHQLHPDRRTRYVSFDGPATPQREALVERAVSLLPKGGLVVLAAWDGNRDLRNSVEKSVGKCGQALQYDPPTPYGFWRAKLLNDRDLRHEAPGRLRIAERARTGPELGR